MNRTSWLLAILVLAGSCRYGTRSTIAGIERLMDSLQQVYAPDPRIELWKLSVTESHGNITLEGEVADEATYQAIAGSMSANYPEANIGVRLLPEGYTGQFVNGLVNNSVSHMRSGPNDRTEMVSQVLLGTPVRILKEENGWRFIQTPDGYLGWVNDSEVRRVEPSYLNDLRGSEKVIFTEPYGFSYIAPDPDTIPVSDLVAGCILKVLDKENGFYRMEYPDGRTGWVEKGKTAEAEQIFNRLPAGGHIIKSALKFNGVPYMWGGRSSKAFDCSGLTSFVYYMSGVSLPRDASQQSLCGKVITDEYDSRSLLPGDLLFFGAKATGSQPERVNHVALYMGNGEFIHASGYRDRVGINSMDSTQEKYIKEYPGIFVRAVRIIGNEYPADHLITENKYYSEIFKKSR